jgi:hypothetical protein
VEARVVTDTETILTIRSSRIADKEVLKDLLEDGIKDLYFAEKQLTKAAFLPHSVPR